MKAARIFLWNGEKGGGPMGFMDRFKKPNEETIGWTCPKCGKVLAPFIIYCPFCADSDGNKEPVVTKEMKVEMENASKILDEWLNGEGGGR